jgi:hypothetical protein
MCLEKVSVGRANYSGIANFYGVLEASGQASEKGI